MFNRHSLATAIGIVALGCSSGYANSLAQLNDRFNTIRTNNVKSGESDYPTLNTNPHRLVKIAGVLPDTLKIAFQVYYAADTRVRSAQAGNYCGYKANAESFPPYDLTDALKVTRKSGRYEGDVIIDKYLPGRCGWHLEFVGYKVKDGPPIMSEGYFAGVYDASRAEHQSIAIYRGNNDIWCRLMTARAGAPAGEQCESFSMMKSLSKDNPIPPSIVATIPTNEYEHQPTTIWILPDTRIIEVNFHDLDAMERELAR